VSSDDRGALIKRVIREARGLQSASEAFDEAVAAEIEVTRNELRCLDLIDQHTRITAGELARLSGLTTGAITGLVNRLERRGLVVRIREQADRRRVLLETTPALRELVHPIYRRFGAQARPIFDGFDDSELEVIADFLRQGRELNEESLAHLSKRGGADPEGALDPSGG
jgi:DNA-binding MarR family transcriptional regulator